MNISFVRVMSLALCAVVLLSARASGAESLDGDDAAVVEFKEARKLFKSGAYQEALAKFEQVAAELNSPNAVFYAARCLEKLGRRGEAYERLGDAVRIAEERAKDEPRYLEARDAAAEEQKRLEQRIGRVTIALGTVPEGVKVVARSKVVPPERYNTTVAVEPGAFWLRVTAPGYEDVTVRRHVAAGSLQTIVVALTPKGSSESSPAETGAGLNGLQIGGLTLAGVGVAGWVVFAVVGSMAQSDYDDIRDACGQTRCVDTSFNADIEDGRALATVANVGFGVGVGGTALGVALLLIGSFGGDEPDTAGVTVNVSPQAASLSYELRF